ncbi:MAG: queuosine salvage family protein [Solirubrobacteraceae bacterium]
MDDLRRACARVSERARHVRVQTERIAAYAATLPLGSSASSPPPARTGEERERAAAHWLTLDAINFGSGWFPTLRKSDGRSGYRTISDGLERHTTHTGPWTAAELAEIDPATIATVLGQDPRHELMALFAASLADLGRHVTGDHEGSFSALVDAAAGSAINLARRLGSWPCFADVTVYQELELPFLKRAQIAAADLERAGVARFSDLDRLTMFADNLVPHVLRLDGILAFDPELVGRIERAELIEPGSPEEVEIRAGALHAVELIVAARPGARAADVDQLLWERGQGASYKASPRHRCRCTAY